MNNQTTPGFTICPEWLEYQRFLHQTQQERDADFVLNYLRVLAAQSVDQIRERVR